MGGHFRSEKFRCAFSVKKQGGVAALRKISLQKAQHFFPKIGGGSEAVWKFSENSSNLVQVNVPKIAPQFGGEGNPKHAKNAKHAKHVKHGPIFLDNPKHVNM